MSIEEFHDNNIESIFNEIIAEIFQSLGKEMPVHRQEKFRTPNM